MLTLNFSPFPELETDRLRLRKLKPEDAPGLFVLRSDPEIMKYIPRPVAVTVADVTALIQMVNELADKNESISWAIALKETDQIIGTIGFVRLSKENHRGEVGYMLSKDFHGKGFIGEALKAVLRFGFSQLKFHTIFAIVDPENIASSKLLERNGFVKEAYFKEDCYYEGRFLDSVHYSLMNPESRG